MVLMLMLMIMKMMMMMKMKMKMKMMMMMTRMKAVASKRIIGEYLMPTTEATQPNPANSELLDRLS